MGKICMITRANSGIREAAALALVQLGATVVIICHNREKGDTALTEVNAKSDRVASVKALIKIGNYQEWLRHQTPLTSRKARIYFSKW